MKRFFALSRTTHGILDIATPSFVALLWLGKFPEWQVILLSVFTAFAAYTATYALNDLVGITVDREKFSGGINPGYSVEASNLRYPLAQNALSYRSGLLWFVIWFVLALIGSYLLNPAVVVILVAATILEVVYCLLHKVTYLRTLVSGLVKSSGPIAAIYVVDTHPAFPLQLLVLAWVFFWEIGGQNVPADWNDTVEDKRVNAKTISLATWCAKGRHDRSAYPRSDRDYQPVPASGFTSLPRLDFPSGDCRCWGLPTPETGI